MSATISTSGSHGINGDLNASGTIKATAIDSTIIKLNGTDITTALTGVADAETKVTNIISGSQAVGLANNVNINKLAVGDSSSYNFTLGSLNGGAGGSAPLETSPNLSYTRNTAYGDSLNLSSNLISLNAQTTDSTIIYGQLNAMGATIFNSTVDIKGKLTCDAGELETGKLTINGELYQSNGPVSLGDLSNAVTIKGGATVANGLQVNGYANGSQGIVCTGISTSGTNILSGSNYFYGNNYWKLNSSATIGSQTDYSSVVTITNANLTNNANAMYNNACLYPEYIVLGVQVGTNPSLQIPDPQAGLLGREIKFIRDIAAASANGCILTTTSTATSVGGFVVSGLANPTFQLGNSGTGWFKVFFVCLLMSDGKYYWVQSYYQ